MIYRVLIQTDDREVYEYYATSKRNAHMLADMFEHLLGDNLSYLEISKNGEITNTIKITKGEH